MSLEPLGEPLLAARAVTLIVAAGQFVAALQLLAGRRLFEKRGMLDWEWMVRRWGRWPTWLPGFGIRAVIAAAILQMMSAGAAALAAIYDWPLAVPLASLHAVSTFLIFRIPVGRTAAEIMSYCVLSALLIGTLGSTAAMAMALVFIAAHSCLAYVTAGAAKLKLPEWRDGSYLRAMISTRYWGHPRLAAWLQQRPRLCQVCAMMVFIGEILFPLVLVAPWKVAIVCLTVGATFHLAVALVMGLNLFFYAFVATYPAILFLNQMIRG